MIDNLINASTARFASSRKIPDELIPFFDQDGHWVGDRPKWRRSTFATAKVRMRGAILPSRRRTIRTREGLHLLTSFVWAKAALGPIHYSSIAGSLLLLVERRVELRAPNLRSIGGNFYTKSNGLIHLPWLNVVGGDFNAMTNSRIEAPRLKDVGGILQAFELPMPALESVGGRLWLCWAMSFNAPKLRWVGGGLKANTASEMAAPKLELVGKDLILGSLTKRVYGPHLKRIGGAFLAEGAEDISASRLRVVGGPIDTSSASGFFSSKLDFRAGWRIHPDAVNVWNLRRVAKRLISDQQVLEI